MGLPLPIVAGMPVKVSSGGEEYLLSPLTLGDWAELEVWAQERLFEHMKMRAVIIDDPDVRKAIQSRMATMTYAEVMRESSPFLDDGKGTARRVYLMLKHNHPDMTLEKAEGLLGFAEFNQAQRVLLGLDSKEGESEDARPTDES